MTDAPTFDDIFATLSAASVGDDKARVPLPDQPQIDDVATRFAVAVNLLLDDLAYRSAEVEAAHKVTKSQLERLVEKRTSQLTDANKELEAFAYTVSHDLRAPLRSMDTFAKMLLEEIGEKLSKDARNYAETIAKNSQGMRRLVDDLLAFSQLTQQPIHRQKVDPAAIVREILEDLKGPIGTRNVDLQIEDLPPCHADPILLRQVYANLVGNAVKFTRKKPEAKITVGWTPSNGGAYYVKDDGVGFDMQYADRLFQVFQRFHRADEFEGTGAGLAIVKRIVTRHGGRIWADADVGKGATFFFTIPESGVTA